MNLPSLTLVIIIPYKIYIGKHILLYIIGPIYNWWTRTKTGMVELVIPLKLINVEKNAAYQEMTMQSQVRDVRI